MTVYQVLSILLLPPGIILLMLVAACVRVRGAGRTLLFGASVGLTLLSLPVVAALLTAPLEPYSALDLRAPPVAEVKGILVLGGGVSDAAPEYGGYTLSAPSLGRVRYAAYLHRATGLPLYVTGGLASAQQPAEGDLMARILREEFAVPVAGVETLSRTTRENAAYSKPMLERAGISHVFLVSDARHLPRAVEACERVGIAVTPAPTGFGVRPHWWGALELSDWLPTASALSDSYYALHEHVGRVWYQIMFWAQGAPRAAPTSASAGFKDSLSKAPG